MTTLTFRKHMDPRRAGLALGAFLAVAAGGVTAALVLPGHGPWADGGEQTPAVPPEIAAPFPERLPDPSIADLEAKLHDNPGDYVSLLAVANAYLQEVRETGDPTYYVRADDALDRAAAIHPDDPELLATQAMLALGRHDFRGALELGKRALAIDPERSRYYGVVADAQIELGMYEEAIASLQEMVNRRPDFNAFSRIAYARELYGDPEGAIEAMVFAVESGSSVPENAAWAHAELGRLYFGFGRTAEAEAAYDAALAAFPGYPVAIAGKARLLAAAGDLDGAAALYQEAFDRMPLPAYAIALGEVAEARGDSAAAASAYGLVGTLDQLYQANGQDTDLELALFLADHGDDPQAAVARARRAYEAAPSVHAADVLAWALLKAGDPAGALQYSTEALRLGSRDPIKLFHAGMIARAAGDPARARELLEMALATNPEFSLAHADEARAALAE
jgi:tetratricopeptide (TPR) repeat protein